MSCVYIQLFLRSNIADLYHHQGVLSREVKTNKEKFLTINLSVVGHSEKMTLVHRKHYIFVLFLDSRHRRSSTATVVQTTGSGRVTAYGVTRRVASLRKDRVTSPLYKSSAIFLSRNSLLLSCHHHLRIKTLSARALMRILSRVLDILCRELLECFHIISPFLCPSVEYPVSLFF